MSALQTGTFETGFLGKAAKVFFQGAYIKNRKLI